MIHLGSLRRWLELVRGLFLPKRAGSRDSVIRATSGIPLGAGVTAFVINSGSIGFCANKYGETPTREVIPLSELRFCLSSEIVLSRKDAQAHTLEVGKIQDKILQWKPKTKLQKSLLY